ncbi:MAG: hypothetical protein INR70_00800 [Parafilimonas terrae]|nr:hypothetical protein [Parafilimonas terrae]
MQTETERARWAAAFADELAGFEPGPYPDVPEEAPAKPASPATRLSVSQEKARGRAQRARDKARRAAELDSAIVEGLRSVSRRRKVLERLRDGEDMAQIAVCLQPVFGTAMERLVLDHGWDRKLASKAITARLLRPAKPPAT